MSEFKIDIHCHKTTPEHTDASQGDTVTFVNKTKKKVTLDFDDGDIFDPPQGPKYKLTIALGECASLVMGDFVNGSRFRYPHCNTAIMVPRTGRIDPANQQD